MQQVFLKNIFGQLKGHFRSIGNARLTEANKHKIVSRILALFLSLNSMLFLLYINMNQNSLVGSSSVEKVKRSSKIPGALRNQFLTALTSQEITIKDAAKRFSINYSTAKAIVKQNKKFLQDKTTRDDSDYVPGNPKIDLKFKEEAPTNGPRCKYEERGQENQRGQSPKKTKVDVISTVAWDFLSNGLP